MTAHRVQDLVEAINDIVGGYEPEDPLELEQFLRAMPDALAAFGTATARLGERLGADQGVHPSVGEAVTESGTAVAAAAGWLENGVAVLRAHHEHDLERHESPRPGEQTFWNVA